MPANAQVLGHFPGTRAAVAVDQRKRAHPLVAFSVKTLFRFDRAFIAAHRRAFHDPNPVRVHFLEVDVRILLREPGCRHPVAVGKIEPPRHLRVHVFRRIEVVDLRGDERRRGAGVEARHPRPAADTLGDTLPEPVEALRRGGDHPHARDDNAAAVRIA